MHGGQRWKAVGAEEGGPTVRRLMRGHRKVVLGSPHLKDGKVSEGDEMHRGTVKGRLE